MGDIKKKRKKYTTPRQLYDKSRIEEEKKVVRNYGLKNKKEIWKVESKVASIRRRAKNLIAKDEESRKKFFNKLNKMGLKINDTADVLALTKEDLLNRRLSSFIVKKGFANTPKQARQLIVHKHIRVNGKIVSAPSFWVTTDLEDKIEIDLKDNKKKSKKEASEKESGDVSENEEASVEKKDNNEVNKEEENGK